MKSILSIKSGINTVSVKRWVGGWTGRESLTRRRSHANSSHVAPLSLTTFLPTGKALASPFESKGIPENLKLVLAAGVPP